MIALSVMQYRRDIEKNIAWFIARLPTRTQSLTFLPQGVSNFESLAFLHTRARILAIVIAWECLSRFFTAGITRATNDNINIADGWWLAAASESQPNFTAYIIVFHNLRVSLPIACLMCRKSHQYYRLTKDRFCLTTIATGVAGKRLRWYNQ